MKKISTILLLYASTCFLLCAQHAGDPDSSFAVNGRYTDSVLADTLVEVATDAVSMQSGKIMVCTDISSGSMQKTYLLRLNTNGTRDLTFGTSGISEIDLGYDFIQTSNIQQQPDGMLLISGVVMNAGGNFRIFVTRVDEDGSTDVTFGTAGVYLFDENLDTYATFSMILQDNGKIVISGYFDSGSIPGPSQPFILRLTSSGMQDNSFSGDGLEIFDGLAGNIMNPSFAVNNTGEIFLSGYIPSITSSYIVKIKDNGDPDSSFANNGVFLTTSPNDILYDIQVDAGGSIFASGEGGSLAGAHALLIKLSPAGVPDISFGTGGEIRQLNPDFNYHKLLITSEGILCSGTGATGFGAAMYNKTDGSLNTGFGIGGFAMNATLPSPNMTHLVPLDANRVLYTGVCDFPGRIIVMAMFIKTEGPLGMDEIPTVQVNVFPNPVTREFMMDAGDITIEKVELFSITGQLVSVFKGHQAIYTLPANIAEGNYVLNISTKDGIARKKIQVIHK